MMRGLGEAVDGRLGLGEQPVHRLAGLVEAEPVLQREEVARDVEGQPHPAVAHALRRPDLAVPVRPERPIPRPGVALAGGGRSVSSTLRRRRHGGPALWSGARRPQHRLERLGVELAVAGEEVVVGVVLIQMRGGRHHREAGRVWVWLLFLGVGDAEMVRVRVR